MGIDAVLDLSPKAQSPIIRFACSLQTSVVKPQRGKIEID
jgi:hypothetical protein